MSNQIKRYKLAVDMAGETVLIRDPEGDLVAYENFVKFQDLAQQDMHRAVADFHKVRDERDAALEVAGVGDPEGVLRKVSAMDNQQAWIEDLRKAIGSAENVLDAAHIVPVEEETLAQRVHRGIHLFLQDLQVAAAEVRQVAAARDLAAEHVESVREVLRGAGVMHMTGPLGARVQLLIQERDAAVERGKALENDLAWMREGVHVARPELERITVERDQIEACLNRTVSDLGKVRDGQRQDREALARIAEVLHMDPAAGAGAIANIVELNAQKVRGEDGEALKRATAECGVTRAERDAKTRILLDAQEAVTDALLPGVDTESKLPLAERIAYLARVCRRVGFDEGFVGGRGADRFAEGRAAGIAACAAALRDRVAETPQPGFEASMHSTAVMLDCAYYLERTVKP